MDRLHRELVRELISEITSGERVEGESLPRESDLAERFDVSRGVARESMRALEERGLIRVKHGRGATVLPADDWDVFDGEVMAGMLTGPRADTALSGALECLRILEPEAAALAAQRAGSQDMQELSRAIDRIDEASWRAATSATARARARAGEVAFHSALMRAAQNPSIARIGEPLHEALGIAKESRHGMQEAPALQTRDYERILEAVAHDDPDGARDATRRCLDALARQLGALGQA